MPLWELHITWDSWFWSVNFMPDMKEDCWWYDCSLCFYLYKCVLTSLCPVGACNRTQWTVLSIATQNNNRDWRLASSNPRWCEWHPWADNVHEFIGILQCCCTSCTSSCEETNVGVSVPRISCSSYGASFASGKVKLSLLYFLDC